VIKDKAGVSVNKQQLAQAGEFYDDNFSRARHFCDEMRKLVETLIASEGINIHSVSGRVKERDSFLKKCEKDKYSDVEQITDLVGVRVITYILEDVEKVCKLIENEFTVDDANSVDKSVSLKENEMGYLSVHYILRLSGRRCDLPEHRAYSGMCFEIQIRTLLQHAWAEFSHDKNYKFAGVLDSKTNRSFFITAGALELIDAEFQRISDAISKYEEAVKEKTAEGDLDSIEINSTSLLEYLNGRFKSSKLQKSFNGCDEKIVRELKDFGLNTISDIDAIVPKDLDGHIEKLVDDRRANYLGLLRLVLIIADAEKYFRECWKEHWHRFAKGAADLVRSYGIDLDKLDGEYHFGIEGDQK